MRGFNPHPAEPAPPRGRGNPGSFASILRLMRPTHWVKNGLVLAGVFFAGALFQPDILKDVALAFAAFCLASSAIYIVNDLADRNSDRVHPRKRNRPLAAGLVSTGTAAALIAFCATASLGLALAVDVRLAIIVGAFLAINAAYSRWLKHVVLIDVFCIAGGFLLRLLAGTWGIGIPPSQWFVLCTFLLSLFLGFSKRYAERMDESQHPADKRAVVEEYSPEFLRVLLSVSLASTLLTYGMYTMSPRTLEIHGTGDLIYSLPLVAFVMFRYLYLVMKQGYGENLSEEILRDRSLVLSLVTYLVVTGFILMR